VFDPEPGILVAFYAPFFEVFEVITRKTLVVVFQRRSKYRRSEL
jgi:hypothetical protein